MLPNIGIVTEEVRAGVHRAIATLLAEDQYLLVNDVNERSITHKLADYLQREFPDTNVDCEYNKNHDDTKRLRLPPKTDIRSDDLDAHTVFPDIIVHKRNTDENLLVIEVKKSTNPEEHEHGFGLQNAKITNLGQQPISHCEHDVLWDAHHAPAISILLRTRGDSPDRRKRDIAVALRQHKS
jgi:hypothetical protein